jgi:hypothetical protein
VKEETAVLDSVTEDNPCGSPDDRAAYRMGPRNIPARTASEEVSLGGRVKRLFVNLGRAIERRLEHDHEFDHW